MLEFNPQPHWLKRNLGTVADRIGAEGSIQIHARRGNKVILKLSRGDASFELLPASISLSALIVEGKMPLEEVMDCEILELDGGYVCISVFSGSINIDDLSSDSNLDQDFLPPGFI